MGDINSAYKKAGVDYGSLDPVKVLSQKRAAESAKNLSNHGLQEVSSSRGESAYVWQEGDKYRAFVVEGLGTKNLIADELSKVTGKSYYDQIAQDCVAMIVNDLITVGALPEVINAYFAVGDSKWMNDKQRAEDLINGWAKACELSESAWGGGETPALKGIIDPSTIDLAGSAVGSISSSNNLVLSENIQPGDKIVLVESSGVHSNGITLIRSLADTHKDAYLHKLEDGRMFGEALLSPTHIYVKLVKEIQNSGIDVHYMVNITGHGWRKIMRANADFTYEINQVPDVPAEFEYIKSLAELDDEQMYATYNMGAGFAFILPEDGAEKIVDIAKTLSLRSWVAGEVKQGEKQVVIKPKNIVYKSDSLGVR